MLAGLAVAGLGGGTLAPTPAQANAADYFIGKGQHSVVPRLLSADERTAYRDIFAAIHKGDWARAKTLLQAAPDGPLQGVARAEFYLAANSPKADLAALTDWLGANITLPQAEQIAALAAKRGATALPARPVPQALVAMPAAPRRTRPRSIADGTMPLATAAAINDRIKADDPTGARLLLETVDATLSPEARAEWRQKIAWAHYITNHDTDAYGLAIMAAKGGGFAPLVVTPEAAQGPAQPTLAGSGLFDALPVSAGSTAVTGGSPVSVTGPAAMPEAPRTTAGSWVAEAWWTAGLAAWRAGDCSKAADAFEASATRAANPELIAASLFWQARSLVRCRQPEQAGTKLRAAARLDETLYGMLAGEQLGLHLPDTHASADLTAADWQALRDNANVRAGVALAEIGEDGLADEVLRYQARIGTPDQFAALARLARDLGLPGTQLWMAANAPGGTAIMPASRYPTPKWTPSNGWQVDPALVFAHALQESQFRANAVSPMGARGVMQVLPSTARDHASLLAATGTPADLAKPEINIAVAQEHMKGLKNAAGTQGLLLKVVAAYNAGLLSVQRWNGQINDGGDPLLWMESVPFWETRAYVAAVLRNYWMYERQAGGPKSESRVALAQGLWPSFPGPAGAVGLTLDEARRKVEERAAERLAQKQAQRSAGLAAVETGAAATPPSPAVALAE